MMLGGPDVVVSEFFRQHGFLKMLVVDLGYRAMPLRRVSKGQKNSKIHRQSLLARAVALNLPCGLRPYATSEWAAGNVGATVDARLVMPAFPTSSPCQGP